MTGAALHQFDVVCNGRGFIYDGLIRRLRKNKMFMIKTATMGDIFGNGSNGLGDDLVVSMGNSEPRANAPADAPQPVLVSRFEVIFNNFLFQLF